MTFNDCLFIDDQIPFRDLVLVHTYFDKWVLNISIGSMCNKEKGHVLEINYTTTFHTQDNRLIEKYLCAYKCTVIRREELKDDEILDLWGHIKDGLKLALTNANIAEHDRQDSVLAGIVWNTIVEKAYNEAILCDNN